jgi:hypothetical protein
MEKKANCTTPPASAALLPCFLRHRIRRTRRSNSSTSQLVYQWGTSRRFWHSSTVLHGWMGGLDKMCQKHLFISLASLFCEVVHLLLVAFKPRKWSAFGTKSRILTITHGNQGDALLLLERERELHACLHKRRGNGSVNLKPFCRLVGFTSPLREECTKVNWNQMDPNQTVSFTHTDTHTVEKLSCSP